VVNPRNIGFGDRLVIVSLPRTIPLPLTRNVVVGGHFGCDSTAEPQLPNPSFGFPIAPIRHTSLDTIPLPGDGQVGLLVTVDSFEYTIGIENLRVLFNGRTSASQADDVPIHSKADIDDQRPNIHFWPKADLQPALILSTLDFCPGAICGKFFRTVSAT